MSIPHALDPSGNAVPLKVDADGGLMISGDITLGDVTVSDVEISNDSGNPIPVSGTVTIGSGTVTIGNLEAAPVPVNVVDGTISITAGDLTIENIAITSIAAGDNNIGNVDIASIAAGDNNIGNVDIASALPAGTNKIGSVDIASALPAGTNNIGDVDVLSLPALPAGTNNIGDVDVLSLPALPAGTNNIGDVDVLTLPAIPAGSNSIGSVTLNAGGSVGLDSLPHANLGAFGDLETMAMTPVLQLSFATGIRDQLVTTAVANSATVDSNTGRLRLQTGTNAAGSAQASSVRPVAYRPGQGVTARFTPIFAGSAASSTQIVGMGNSVDGYFVGYNGAAFGIMHRLSGSDTWVAQSNWNGDTCDGEGASGFDMDPTKGNVWQIKYPYLGHGNIRFYVLNPATSLWILVHTIQYANASAVPQLTNPLLQFHAHAVNSGNTSNLISYVTCAAAFIDGERHFLGANFGADTTQNTTTSERNLISIRNATTVNGVANRGMIRLRQISVSNSGNTYNILRIKRGASASGAAFAAISGTTADAGVTITSAQSTAAADVAGTTVSGGVMIYNAATPPGAGFAIDLTPYDLYIPPGETWVFSMQSGANSTCTMCVNWQEDVQ